MNWVELLLMCFGVSEEVIHRGDSVQMIKQFSTELHWNIWAMCCWNHQTRMMCLYFWTWNNFWNKKKSLLQTNLNFNKIASLSETEWLCGMCNIMHPWSLRGTFAKREIFRFEVIWQRFSSEIRTIPKRFRHRCSRCFQNNYDLHSTGNLDFKVWNVASKTINSAEASTSDLLLYLEPTQASAAQAEPPEPM